MPVIRAAVGVWCDICKQRWPKGHPLYSKPASWTTISETIERKGRTRNYCQSCAEETSQWGDEIWELQDQINYALIKSGEQLDV